MKNLYLIILATLSQTILAQNIKEHKKTNNYTYIFKLTNEEADFIYHNSVNSIDSSFFFALVN